MSGAYLFFGRSGSGKGTQAELLLDYLKEKGKEVVYIETGKELRAFTQEDNEVARRTKDLLDEGGLMPAFLPIWLWTGRMVRDLHADKELILDGAARRMVEAPVLDSAFTFFGRNPIYIVYVDVSRAEATRRMLLRKRADDSPQEIEERLNWFDQDVVPVIDYFAHKEGYTFLHINGEQSPEDVQKDIRAGIIQDLP